MSSTELRWTMNGKRVQVGKLKGKPATGFQNPMDVFENLFANGINGDVLHRNGAACRRNHSGQTERPQDLHRKVDS